MKLTERVGKKIWRQVRFVLMAAGVFVSGCGGGNETPSQKVEVVQGLQVQKMQLQNVADELEAPGSVIAVSTAQVAARTTGTVLQVAVREGDTVRRGQILAQLDERELASRRNAAQAGAQGATAGVAQATMALAAAQAQAEVMKKTYDRYAYLKEQKSISPQEFDEITAKQQGAQANLEQAKAGLRQAEAGASQAEAEARAAQEVASYARVVAPFDGRVIRRTVEPGSLVSPGNPLFIVEDTSRYQLEATLPAEALAIVKKSASARVELDALADKSWTGKVAEIEAGADPASHTLKARIDLPKEAGVQSGMFGRAFVPRGEKLALMVPVAALVNRGQLRGIYVVGDVGLVHWRVVTLGKPLGNQVEVLSGLTDGEAVVLNPGSQELDGKKSGVAPTGREKHS
ncbi:MAG TPA: efflux RND transporter periplasmic adaptor subunit [Candidatus Dormibacteraeota bacterium]|nr:efflux RND transporter periplasmic adaptor subunit [Candidatus Dormibacteraeota bacterium]